MNLLTSVSNKKMLRKKLEADTKKFLKNGGKIQKIPFGVQKDDQSKGFS